MDQVTVVVPTRNEAHNIVPFLDSLPPTVPLVIVDASSDATPDLVAKHRPTPTRLLRHPGTVTEARQVGAELAETEWLLFTDADVAFAPGYFKLLPRCDPEAVIYGPKLSMTGFARYYRWFARGQALSHRMGIPAATGSNLWVKREIFRHVNGFDLDLTCNEDSELVWRIARSGFPVRFAPDLIVYALDHRRLEQGLVRKTMHSILRCGLLYFNLMPHRWRGHDWGYWSHRSEEAVSNKVVAKG